MTAVAKKSRTFGSRHHPANRAYPNCPPIMKSLNEENLVTVAERPTESAAHLLVSLLADAGIRSVATGGHTAGFRAEAPGWVQVKTMESDAANAKKLIAELEEVDE